MANNAQSILESGTNSQPSAQTSSAGVRLSSSKRSIYDRNLNRSRTSELSRASFALLFSEMVTYAQRQVTDITDLEKRYILCSSGIFNLSTLADARLKT